MKTEIITDYDVFLKENRIKVNRYMNRVLWFFLVTGPAIALGIKGGIFLDITYTTCFFISAIVAVLAAIHLFLYKKFPGKTFTYAFALIALDVLLMYMFCSHVSIYLTWFLVPLLSLLFCEKYLYFAATIFNYILMATTVWVSSSYEASLRPEYNTAAAYFLDTISGFTIETIIMFASGFIIGKLTLDYYKKLFYQYELIKNQEKAMKEKMEILDSMAEIYDNVNLIDFVNNTEMSLRDSEQKKHGIDMNNQTHTLMNQKIKNQVMPNQLDDFLTFTNIKTIRSRLSLKKLISADFIDVVSGWFRAQYITVDSTVDGIPNVVIYTTRNVDEEKRREENLIRISMTDEMTRLFNRRCYDEDLRQFRNSNLADNFVLFSIDVNGLKTVNDTKGHAAGDELIKGAANCLLLSIGNNGKVYRTGGDEFMAVIHTENPEELRETINTKTKEWHGVYTEKISMSIGYASHKDNPAASIDELERLADADMYNEKDKYYKENGIERRRQA
jgi:diguanylate cyclase (GGDEF)-like protein